MIINSDGSYGIYFDRDDIRTATGRLWLTDDDCDYIAEALGDLFDDEFYENARNAACDIDDE